MRANVAKASPTIASLPVAPLAWSDPPNISLSEHLRGSPRIAVGISYSDAEFWTPVVLGQRLLFPTRAKGLRSGALEAGSELRLRLGSPPEASNSPRGSGLFSRVRYPEIDQEVCAPTGDGYFVVLDIGEAARTVKALVTSNIGARSYARDGNAIPHRGSSLPWGLAAPPAAFPSNIALEQVAEEDRCSARDRQIEAPRRRFLPACADRELARGRRCSSP